MNSTHGKEPVRLAIISTPRTGNNWLQNLLSRAYAIPGFSPTTPSNVTWTSLPRACVLILHWPPTLELRRRLQSERFQAISLARHPLDVLISILHFTLREPTDGWLEGQGGNEQAILGVAPASDEFLSYAIGPRADALLDITRAWWQVPGCHRVHYEDLARDPLGTMMTLVTSLAVPCRRPLEEAVAASSLSDLRQKFAARRHHFWQGTPGIWRQLLPASFARAIVHAQSPCFTDLGYPCQADPNLSLENAHARWLDLLQVPADPAANPASLLTLQRALTHVKRDLEVTRAQLAELEKMGPLALNLARRIRQWAGRFPRLAAMMKKALVAGPSSPP